MYEQLEPEITEVLDVADQLAAGLLAFHRKEMLHQDLKPENIVFDGDGVLKIVDFGSCHVAGIQEIAAPIERDPLRFWKGLAALLALAWVATLSLWMAN